VPGSSGTDFSQQNAAQFALTGLTSSGSGNTILSAAAAASMVGNIAQAISGTNINPGFFQVVSVVAGVSITFSTNPAGTSICSGVAAAGVVNIGGALATIAKLFTAWDRGNFAWANGVFTQTTVITINANFLGSGNINTGNTINGYATVRGDSGRATLTTATNSTDLFSCTSLQGLTWRNLLWTNTATVRARGLFPNGSNDISRIAFENCVADGFTIWVDDDFDGLGVSIFDLSFRACEAKNCTGAQAVRNGGSTYFRDNYFHDNVGAGFRTPITRCLGATAVGNIWAKNGARGFDYAVRGGSSNGLPFMDHNVFVDNTSDGFAYSDGSNNGSPCIYFENNISYGNGGFGAQCGNPVATAVGQSNFYGANTSGARSANMPAFTGDQNLTADPFVNRATGDYRLNTTAGGGAVCRQGAFPGTFINGTVGFANGGVFDPQLGTPPAAVTVVYGPRITQFVKKG
jgi:hypothetical protein